MRLELFAKNLRLSEKYRSKVTRRFTSAIDKHLRNLQEDLKKASLTVKKNPRFGYETKFDMKLPFAHLFAHEKGVKLSASLSALRDNVVTQLRKQIDKLRK